MTPAKRTRPAKELKSTVPEPVDAADDLLESVLLAQVESDQDSDHSEYGKKGKGRNKPKRRKTSHFNPGRAPRAPDLSENEFEDPQAELLELGDLWATKTTDSSVSMTRFGRATPLHNRSVPKILKIQVQGTKNGPPTINLDLAGILLGDYTTSQNSSLTPSSRRLLPTSTFDDNESTLLDDEETINSKKKARKSRCKALKEKKHRVGFLDLPFELKERIYRQVFVTEDPIDFASRENFSRSSAFLRTCKSIHREGRIILYGENAFHFERTAQRRGHFYEKVWKEVGFKDVRRFLDTIGPENISFLKYISFLLVDAAPSLTPYQEEEERRFVNDPVLYYIFNLIGSYATLSKLAFTFGGRRQMSTTDFFFIQAISRMRCHEFVHSLTVDHHHSKANMDLVERMKKTMVVARPDEDDIDFTKRKTPTIRMQYEKGQARYTVW